MSCSVPPPGHGGADRGGRGGRGGPCARAPGRPASDREGFVENLAVNHDDGVSAQNGFVEVLVRDCLSFFAGQAFCADFCRLVWERVFVDVRGLDFEGDVGVAEEFLATRRGGG